MAEVPGVPGVVMVGVVVLVAVVGLALALAVLEEIARLELLLQAPALSLWATQALLAPRLTWLQSPPMSC